MKVHCLFAMGRKLLLLAAFGLSAAFVQANTAFDVWYGDNQQFGVLAEPQRQINILGNVSDPDGIQSLDYSLNGAADQSLILGPYPNNPRRLVGVGDFNVEIQYTDLVEGQNTIELKALDGLSELTVKTIIVNYSSGNTLALPYSVNWSAVANVQDVVQVVDGLWSFDATGISVVHPGYDRTIAIGDIGWDNYEITTTVTVNGIDPRCIANIDDCRGNPAVWVVLRWQGHWDWGTVLPSFGYYPVGAAGGYKYTNDLVNGFLVLDDGEFNTIAQDFTKDLPFGVSYQFKLRAETQPGIGHNYRIKMWPTASAEPEGWDLVGDEPLTSASLGNGSLLLVAHNVLAKFGNVAITALPLVAEDDANAATTPENVAVDTVDVLANDTLVNNGVIDSFDALSANGGSVVNNGDGTFHYTPMSGYVGSDSFTYTLINDDLQTDSATVTVAVYSPGNPSGMGSDNFNGGSLNSTLWSVFDPVGDTTVAVNGSQLLLSIPGAVEHSIWDNGNLSTRVMQASNNLDFDVVAKFSTLLTGRYQSQGILVEQDDGNYIRFDFYTTSSGASTRIFAGTVLNSVPTQRVKTVIGNSAPLYMRVKRVGDQWTQYYSSDGVNWVAAVNFTYSLVVNSVGVFAANYDNSSGAFEVQVDEFNVLVAGGATPPVAVDDPDAAATLENVAVDTINVLANDSLLDNAVISAFDAVSANAGAVSSNGDGTFHYIPATGFVGTDSFTYTLTDDDSESDTATVSIDVYSASNPSGMASDDFNTGTLNGIWTVTDPVGDATVSMSGAELSIAVPAAVEHSIWNNGNLSVRVMQPSNNTDLDVVAKFSTMLGGRYQSQGILVDDGAGKYIRFDFYNNSNASNMRIFAATTTAGNPTQQVKTDIADGAPLYLRVTRAGDQWTEYYSFDGINWTTAVTFSYALNVESVGVFAANHDAAAPAYTVLVDDFSVQAAGNGNPPVAVDDPDAATALDGFAVNTVNVLLNDSLVDNAVISGFDSVSVNGGAVVSNGDGTFQFTNFPGFLGTDSFTYTLTDDDMETSTATVSITVNERPPGC